MSPPTPHSLHAGRQALTTIGRDWTKSIDLAAHANIHPSTMTRILNELIVTGLAERTGKGPQVRYRQRIPGRPIEPNLRRPPSTPSRRRPPRPTLAGAILVAVHQRPATAAQLARRLHRPPAAVNRELLELHRAGEVRAIRRPGHTKPIIHPAETA